MEGKQITSKFLSLQTRDFIKGLLIAALTPIVPILIAVSQPGNFKFDWTMIWQTAAGGLVAYLAKNFFESTKTVIIVKPAIDTEGEKDVNVTNERKSYTTTQQP